MNELLTDISHITFKLGAIVGRSGHRWKEFRSAAIRSCQYGCLGKHLGNFGQAKGIVKLSIDKHTAVSGDLGTVKFQLQTAVEIDP